MVQRVRLSASVGRRSTSSGSPHSANANSARQGFQGVMKNFEKLLTHLHNNGAQVLYEALEPTFEKSQEYCPKDTGALLESGYLVITDFRGIPTVEMGYGRGGEPDYAVTVHENLEWRHKSPTRAKWLQVAIDEDAQAIQGRVVAGYKVAGGF